jgi:hypothetical protein
MNKQDIVNHFNLKLKDAINALSVEFNTPSSEIKIIIEPENNLPNPAKLKYLVYSKQGKLCDAEFEKIIHLSLIESLATNKKTIEEYIINSLVKFSIGAVCEIYSFDIMIFLNSNGGIKIALLKDKNIINYFTVDKLF